MSVGKESLELVDTQKKDGDPRKFKYIHGLFKRHPHILPLWRDFGLMVRATDEGKKGRQHMVTEHMIAVAAGSRSLGLMFQEKNLLTEIDVGQIEEAGLVHDTSKIVEVLLVQAASEKDPDIEKIEALVHGDDIIADSRLLTKHTSYYLTLISDPSRSSGLRAVSAFDYAGVINDLRLKAKGVDEQVRAIAGAEAFHACPEIERLLLNYDAYDPADKEMALKMFILHYVDNIVTNPNRIEPAITVDEQGNGLNAVDRRALQNENNPNYTWNQGWRENPFHNGETAMDIQRRVSHSLEIFFAGLLRIEDPLMMPAIIDNGIQKIIQNS